MQLIDSKRATSVICNWSSLISFRVLFVLLLLLAPSKILSAQKPDKKASKEHVLCSQKEFAGLRKEQKNLIHNVRKIKAVEGSVRSVLENLSVQYGEILQPSDSVDGDRLVVLKAGKKSLSDALFEIGLRFSPLGNIQQIPPYSFAGESSGLHFFAQLTSWERYNSGAIIHCQSDFRTNQPQDRTRLQWGIDQVFDKKKIPFETCAWHSPSRYLVRDVDGSPKKLLMKADYWWTFKMNLKVEDVKDGDTIKVGPHVLEIRWPYIVTKSRRAVPKLFQQNMLVFGGKLKPDIEEKVDEPFGGRRGGRKRARRGLSTTTWCGCQDKCRGGTPRSIDTHKRGTKFHAKSTFHLHAIDDMAELKITFKVPVHEKLKFYMKPMDQ